VTSSRLVAVLLLEDRDALEELLLLDDLAPHLERPELDVKELPAYCGIGTAQLPGEDLTGEVLHLVRDL
jgi:hypothetical protein